MYRRWRSIVSKERPLGPPLDFLANATQASGRVLLCAESAGRLPDAGRDVY